MSFKHPEILYFLFFLGVPILVHLFQFRRFKTEYFTNVKFLQQLNIESRKSSKIKKRLLLVTRLLLLFFLILAFAQPFWDTEKKDKIARELYVILDNSFSMQAKGSRGELLQRAVQDLLESIPDKVSFSLLTNDAAYWNTDKAAIQKELQQLSYSAVPFNSQGQLQKIYSKNLPAPKDIVIVSDGFEPEIKKWFTIPKSDKMYWVPAVAQYKKNVSIDSVALATRSEKFYDVSVYLKSYDTDQPPVSVALYNNNQLVAKSMARWEKTSSILHFTLPQEPFHGYAKLIHPGLSYDDTYYFTIAQKVSSRVLCIGLPEKNEFLSRIYTPDSFQLTSSTLPSLDYNLIPKQNTVVLNELEDIPQALQTTLLAFVKQGGALIIIPSAATSLEKMNSFLAALGNLRLQTSTTVSKQLTTIHFNHPLFQGVFEQKVRNFQYPKTEKNFTIQSKYPSVLSYEDEQAFLTTFQNSNGRVFVFAAPINTSNSNFQQSPLIVPVFYQMGINPETNPLRAIPIGEDRQYWVNTTLAPSSVLQVKGAKKSFIPLQQIADGKVRCQFGSLPETAGNYEITLQNKPIDRLSFNYKRTESDLTQNPILLPSTIEKASSLPSVFLELESEAKSSYLWKWFLIFALVLFLTEMAILRFIK